MRVLIFKHFFLALAFLLIFQKGFSSFVNLQEVRKGTSIEAIIKPEPDLQKEQAAQDKQIIECPDTNFTYEKYEEFLLKVSDTSKYLVLPINEFRKVSDTGKIVIGLRHDVDIDLELARKFSQTEKKLGFRSTYYILHTADYYLEDQNNKAVHADSIIPVLLDMQNNSGLEIGWHNDLVTLQVVYQIDPVDYFHRELDWLRSNGLKISGTASHGSDFCREYNYLNFYFFEECTWPIVGYFENNIEIPGDTVKIILRKGKLSEFDLEYEAYFLNNNNYFSDASLINGERWHPGMLDLDSLRKGDRVIILLHPIHWHPGSVSAEIESFSVPGQKGGSINSETSAINIVMPYGTILNELIPVFSLSKGAFAKVQSSMQTSGISKVSATGPVVYRVFAENRSITKEWTVNFTIDKNSAASVEEFSFPGLSVNDFQNPVIPKVVSKDSLPDNSW
jgi:hypothetical protein